MKRENWQAIEASIGRKIAIALKIPNQEEQKAQACDIAEIDIVLHDIRLLSPLESSMERQKTMREK